MASRASPTRDLSIDNLRTLAVLLLLPFHTLGLYSYLPYHLHEQALSATAHRTMLVMHLWHMPILFLLAGCGAVAGLAKRGVRLFIRERLKRLGIPLLFGIFVLAPPMVYLERISPDVANRWSPIDFDGSFLEFYPEFFRCCYPEANLSYHHLWFVNFLLVFSLVLWPAWLWLSGPGGARLAERLVPRPEAGWRLLLVGLILVACEILLNPISRYTFKFYEDWARDANYILALLFGGWLFAQPRLWDAVPRATWPAVVLALAFTALFFAVDPTHGLGVLATWPDVPWYMHAVWGAAEWSWLIALVGLARRFLARPIPFITAFAPFSMSFYILHMPIVIGTAYALLDWQAGFWVKWPVQMAIAGTITYGLCRLFDLTPVTRVLMGTRAWPSSARPAAGARLARG
jgi:hypothetical protein